MEFFAVVDTQRALRRFRPDPVGVHELRRILDAATRAPSARGAEPWVFVVVRDAGLRAEIGRHYAAAWDGGRALHAGHRRRPRRPPARRTTHA